MRSFVSQPVDAINGNVSIPGDKSISHRSLIFGSLAVGTTTVRGLLEGTDVMSTKDALVALGVEINRDNEGIWHIVHLMYVLDYPVNLFALHHDGYI